MKRKILKAITCFCMVILITGILALPGVIEKSFAKEPIRIGLIGIFSSPFGASDKAALEISVDELNQAGGILGRPVEFIAEDFKSQVPLAVAAYKKLVMKDKCVLIFVEGTEASMACAQLGVRLYQAYPHLLFSYYSAGFSMADIVGKDYNTFKFIFHPEISTTNFYNPDLKLMEFFKDTIGTKKLALLIEDMSWTELFRKGKPGGLPSMKAHFEKNGIQVVFETVTDVKEKMFLPILEKVAVSGADTIYWITGYTDTVALVKQWAQSPAKNMDLVIWAGASSYASFWKMTGERALGATPQGPEIYVPYTKLTKPFLDKLRAKGVGVMSSTQASYDMPWLLKSAIEKAGSADNVEKLIKIIEGIEFQRGFWVWAFDKVHDSKKGATYHPYTLGQFQGNGRFILVHPKNLAAITNPKDKYVRVKVLRKKAGQ